MAAATRATRDRFDASVEAIQAKVSLLETLSGLDESTRALAALRALSAIERVATAERVRIIAAARDGFGRGLDAESVAQAAGMPAKAIRTIWREGGARSRE